MSHTTLYQLKPSAAFTEPQRREINDILQRLSTNLPRLLDDFAVPDQVAVPATSDVQTDKNFTTIIATLNEILTALRGLGLKH